MVALNKRKIDINERQLEIITFLSSRNTHVTIDRIAKMFDRSQRTIRSDLDAIEYVLKKFDMSLERKPGVGIKLNFDERKIEKILSIYKHKVYSSEERMLFVLIIIMTKEKTTFEEIAGKLQVSKNTTIQDLKLIEVLLEKYNIKINKKPYHGIYIDGNEDEIRSYLLQLYKKSTKHIQLDINKYITGCLKEDKDNIHRLIEGIENLASIKYSEEALDELEIMISFALCRMSIGNIVEYSSDYIEEQKLNKNYSILQDCIKTLKYKIPESEICYLLKLFSGAKSTLGNFITEDSEIDELIVSIIKDMCNSINISLTDDADFKEQKALHLKVAIFRLRNNLIIDNPMIEEIQYKMSFIYSITEEILLEYESLLKVKFPKAEIAYIAMYLTALFERNVKDKSMFKVLIICNGGLATSTLLKTRIRAMFPEIQILEICRLSDVESNLEKYEVDFLISAMPLVLDDYKVIQVNPLLGLNDIEKIKAETFNRRYQNNCEFLVRKVKNEDKSEISKILPRKYSQIGVETNDWREAIQLAAKPLIKDQKIKRQYVNEMINVIENIGNYMVFIPEIAFVHAGPTLVVENSVSILVLKNPIKFGSKKETLVKVIIVLANKDENMNLVNLVNILTKEGNIRKLKEATCYEDIAAIK